MELEKSKQRKQKSESSEIFITQFAPYSNEIKVEGLILDTDLLEETKDSQVTIDKWAAKLNDSSSYRDLIIGIFKEKGYKSQRDVDGAIDSYRKGLKNLGCQQCALKLCRMNLETMEIKEISQKTHFDNVLKVCSQVLLKHGLFSTFTNDQFSAPLFHYLCIMLDIFSTFRYYVFDMYFCC